MLYALKRADGTVAITTLVPQSLALDDGTLLEIAKVDGFGKKLFVRDPETDALRPISFAGEFRDLDENSAETYGKLIFPDIVAEIAKMPTPGEYVEWHRISLSDVPTDRTFRDAWTHAEGVKVHVHMDKAREIHKNKIREARAPILAALDVEYQRADEAGDTSKKQTVAAKKQALRDATKYAAIDTVTTPDQLKAAWPDVLGAREK